MNIIFKQPDHFMVSMIFSFMAEVLQVIFSYMDSLLVKSLVYIKRYQQTNGWITGYSIRLYVEVMTFGHSFLHILILKPPLSLIYLKT